MNQILEGQVLIWGRVKFIL